MCQRTVSLCLAERRNAAMDTRRIGDLEVTIVGIGCNNFARRLERAGAGAVVHAAMEADINLFDTADVYGDGASEEYLGRALGSRRDEVIIATKFGVQLGDDPNQGGASPRWIERAVEDSLRRPGTDRIDLYQLLQPLRGPDRSRPIHLARAWPCPVRERAKRVQPAAPGARERCNRGVPEKRVSAAAVLPAGQRDAHGQVHPRRGGARRQPAGPYVRFQGGSVR